MICDVGMVINGGRDPKMFLESFPKIPCRVPSVLLTTLQSVTLVPINKSTFLYDGILVLGQGDF